MATLILTELLYECCANTEDEEYMSVTAEKFIRPEYATTYGRIGKYDVAPTTEGPGLTTQKWVILEELGEVAVLICR